MKFFKINLILLISLIINSSNYVFNANSTSKNTLCPTNSDICNEVKDMPCNQPNFTELNNFVSNYNNALNYLNVFLNAQTTYSNLWNQFSNNTYQIQIPTNTDFNLGPISATCLDCIATTGTCYKDIIVSNTLNANAVTLPTDCQSFNAQLPQAALNLAQAQEQLVNFLSTNSSCTKLKISNIPQKTLPIGSPPATIYDFNAIDQSSGQSYICLITQIIEKMKNTMNQWSDKCNKFMNQAQQKQLTDQKKIQDDSYNQQVEAQQCDTSMVNADELSKINSISDFLIKNSTCENKWDKEHADASGQKQISWNVDDYKNYTNKNDKLCARVRYAYDHPQCVIQVRSNALQAQYQQQSAEQAASAQEAAARQGWIGMGIGLAGQIPMLALMHYQHKAQMPRESLKPSEGGTPGSGKPTPTESAQKPLSEAERARELRTERLEELRRGESPEFRNTIESLDLDTSKAALEKIGSTRTKALDALDKYKDGKQKFDEDEISENELNSLESEVQSSIEDIRNAANEANTLAKEQLQATKDNQILQEQSTDAFSDADNIAKELEEIHGE